jgi:CRP-like cAMP-binding protein
MQSIPKHLTQRILKECETRSRVPNSGIIQETMGAGARLVNQGGRIDAVFIVLQGAVKIHLATPKGTDFLVAIEGPGSLIGEVEALTGEPATCSATATTEGTTAKISIRDYRQWLASDHEFSLLVNHVLCHRLQLHTNRSSIALSYPIEYSVLNLIKTLAKNGNHSRIQLSKEEIADYLGANIRSINRIMKQLQEKNIVTASKEIKIVSMQNLEQALNKYNL